MTEFMELTVPERVAKGVAWLDENVEDWRSKVTIKDFDITNTCDCVLGQVFAGHSRESGFDYAVDEAHFFTSKETVILGFDAGYFDNANSNMALDFSELQKEWLKVLGEDNA